MAIVPSDRSYIREEDLALAAKAAAGDRAALHEVVNRHARDLYRMARGLCATPADAEDVVQETLLAVFRGIGRFDGCATLLTWMTRILIRRRRRMKMKSRLSFAWSFDEASDTSLEDARLVTTRPPAGEDLKLDLAAALPKLSPEFREVIVLRELQGMSYAEIAATLKIPQGTVESRIHRARLELRQGLRAYRP